MCGGGGGGKSYSRILPIFFSFINIHEYANEISLCMIIVLKDLSNCITDDIITCNKDSLGQNSVYIYFF